MACIHALLTTMPNATISTMRVASAFTSGLTPRRTFEKITIGKVVEAGPATNCDTTTSSHEIVNASSHPETIAGTMSGSVIRKNTVTGRAPKSMAASSNDSSNPASRDWTTTATYDIVKVMCANMIVSMPRPRGQPINCSSATNSSSRDKPVITSGITRGAVVIADKRVRPRNGPKRAKTIPTNVPRTTAPVAAHAATRIDSHAARSIGPFDSSATYHLSVGEFAASQTVTRRELLKENITIERIGTYKNASPMTSPVREK